MLPVMLAIAAILAGTIFITGVGTLANGTKGSACTNCQTTTKTLLNTTEFGFPLSLFIVVIGGAVAAVFAFGRKH